MEFLEVADIQTFAPDIEQVRAYEMIQDASAMAVLAAPCLSGEITDPQRAAVRAILRGAILRWNDAGSGAIVQQQVGPFGQTIDNRSTRRGMFWPSEIADLQRVCEGEAAQSAFAVDTATAVSSVHLPWCTLMFGGSYCSCGVDIAGTPIFEGA